MSQADDLQCSAATWLASRLTFGQAEARHRAARLQQAVELAGAEVLAEERAGHR